MPIPTKVRNGRICIPVPFRQKHGLWEGSVVELISSDEGIIVKPMVQKKERNEMMDKYFESKPSIEAEITTIVCSLTYPTQGGLLLEQKRRA